MPSDAAAIASPLAAEIYGMKVLRKSIEDEKLNFTRFLLLAKKARPVRGVAKTSVVFSLKNELGNLHRILFKVGSGFSPTVPDSVSESCRDFLSKCFQTNPENRWTTNQLMEHSFAKVRCLVLI